MAEQQKNQGKPGGKGKIEKDKPETPVGNENVSLDDDNDDEAITQRNPRQGQDRDKP